MDMPQSAGGLEVDPQPSTPYHSVRSSLLR
jgi:hypothetical protein